MNKKVITIIFIILLILLSIGVYFFFFWDRAPKTPVVNTDGTPGTGFTPIGRNPLGNSTDPIQNPSGTTTEILPTDIPFQLPKLRKLSDAPVSGLAASTTASSSLVRFMDRGTGHIYEATDQSLSIQRISNTTLPRIYESYWNEKATSTVIRYLREDSDDITNFYAELRETASSSNETPFEIKGKYLSPDIAEIAISPNGNQIFTWNIEGEKGIGYISNLDESRKTKIIELPLTQVNIDWPDQNTVTVTTKGSGVSTGYSYSVDIRNGEIKKIIEGTTRGLSVKGSKDMTQVLYSTYSNSKILTYLKDLTDNSTEELIFMTLADKCVWSEARKNEVYCAVPTELSQVIYPDSWYRGNISFTDQIWHLDTETGQVTLIANLLSLGDELIDAVDLTLDNKDNFLYFINKRDLTLWALDLNQ